LLYWLVGSAITLKIKSHLDQLYTFLDLNSTFLRILEVNLPSVFSRDLLERSFQSVSPAPIPHQNPGSIKSSFLCGECVDFSNLRFLLYRVTLDDIFQPSYLSSSPHTCCDWSDQSIKTDMRTVTAA